MTLDAGIWFVTLLKTAVHLRGSPALTPSKWALLAARIHTAQHLAVLRKTIIAATWAAETPVIAMSRIIFSIIPVGWLDKQGNTHEKVFDIVGSVDNSGGVDTESCAAQAAEKTALLQDEGAFGDVYGRCCLDESAEPFYSPLIQERAWTSPIWINPQS